MRVTEIPSPLAIGKERPWMVMELAGWALPEDGQKSLLRRLDRWASDVQWQLMAFHKGRIVRRTDTGLMMEFADARSCVRAAFALREVVQSIGPVEGTKRLPLRAAAHLAAYSKARHEVAGQDVKLTSALAALAQPGELLLTAELRNRLADGLDADFEDLGEREMEPLTRPMRVFKAHPRHRGAADWLEVAKHDLRPGLAVIPFDGGIPEARRWMVGELIADGVIARLSRSVGIRVISRASTSALRGGDGLAEVQRSVGATFVLSGSYRIRGRMLSVSAELVEASSHTLLWSGNFQRALGDLFHEDSELLFQLAYAVTRVLGDAQVSKPLAQLLPRMASNALLLAGISMTHSDSDDTLQRGHMALTALAAKHPSLALPKAWLGLWHALNVIKGKSGNVGRDTQLAHEQTMRALEAEPGNALALAVKGYVQCQLLGDPQQARRYLDAAIEANPSEPMAWLFRSLYSNMWDSTSAGVTEAYMACALSPVDPLRYFFDLLTGNALIADHRYEEAITCINRSLRANKDHVPTLRLLVTAQVELGQIEEGRKTLARLRRAAPDLTVSSYLAMGGPESRMRQRCSIALRQLGLPEN